MSDADRNIALAYCTKCGKESCPHTGWTARNDEALMRRALEALADSRKRLRWALSGLAHAHYADRTVTFFAADDFVRTELPALIADLNERLLAE